MGWVRVRVSRSLSTAATRLFLLFSSGLASALHGPSGRLSGAQPLPTVMGSTLLLILLEPPRPTLPHFASSVTPDDSPDGCRL